MKKYYFTDGFVLTDILDAAGIKFAEKIHGPLLYVNIIGKGTVKVV